MIHVIIINLNHFGHYATLKDMLTHCYNLVGWADGLAATGAQVTVLQRYGRDLSLSKKGTPYHFVAEYGPTLRPWQIPWRIIVRARRLCQQSLAAGCPTIIHMNGMVFPLQTRALRLMLPPAVPLVVQHHASLPKRGWKRPIQRLALRGLDGYMFASVELADDWIEQGIIRSEDEVYEVMEGSSPFSYLERAPSRAVTRMHGNPILFWAGNLDQNKDPITILCGFERLLEAYPAARLYMSYRYADLLPEVEAHIARSDLLSQTTTLLGRLSRDQIPYYFNSADLFVQGSAKEGSGLALLDALVCGVVPVVTDIPSFRTLTDNGRIGALWPVGDADSFVQALERVLRRPLPPQSQAAREFFHDHWSFTAIGRRAVAVYRSLLEQKERQRA